MAVPCRGAVGTMWNQPEASGCGCVLPTGAAGLSLQWCHYFSCIRLQQWLVPSAAWSVERSSGAGKHKIPLHHSLIPLPAWLDWLLGEAWTDLMVKRTRSSSFTSIPSPVAVGYLTGGAEPQAGKTQLFPPPEALVPTVVSQ